MSFETISWHIHAYIHGVGGGVGCRVLTDLEPFGANKFTNQGRDRQRFYSSYQSPYQEFMHTHSDISSLSSSSSFSSPKSTARTVFSTLRTPFPELG